MTPPATLRFGIIGAGMLGLTLALRLGERGHPVTVFEASDALGGQASPWRLGEVTWDRHYHVIVPEDRHLLRLLDELGLSGELVWTPTRTGFFAGGRLHSLSGVGDFLRFRPISLVGKVRLAATVLRAWSLRDLAPYSAETSVEWLRRWSGTAVTETLWEPLLQSKFGEAYRRLPAAFVVASIRRMFGARRGRSQRETFGHVRGGYATILEGLGRRLEALGVDVRLRNPVRSVVPGGGGVRLQAADGSHGFDRAVITAAAPLVPRLCPALPEPEARAFASTPYLGIVCASMVLDGELSGCYITNIADRTVPFTGVIEMSAIVDRRELGGYSLVYLPRYLPADDPFFEVPDDEIEEGFLGALEGMYPRFRRAEVQAFRVSRVRHVMSVPTAGVARPDLPVRTGAPGVFTLDTGHVTDGVLTVNKVMGLAEGALDTLTAGAPPGGS